jgi:glycosyltransferase involved in cell wall biosynthesis
MQILVATNHLQNTGGTECYTYALVQELLRQGHDVEYFAFQLGEISKKIESLGVKFRSHIFYDLIIANHNNVVNHLYKRGFIIQTCHGTKMDLEQPSTQADALVSISQEVFDYLQSKGFSSTIIKNGIDCNRFRPNKPINNELKYVLSLCQSDEANTIVHDACSLIGAHFEKVNKFEENYWEIEEKINQSDLVVGIGRSAYDAMACGRPVISFDVRSYSSNYGDGYLNANNIKESVCFNCSGRFAQTKFNAEKLANEMKKYDINDGVFFRKYALDNFNIETAVKKYIALYPQNRKFIIRIKKIVTLIIRNSYWLIKILLKIT